MNERLYSFVLIIVAFIVGLFCGFSLFLVGDSNPQYVSKTPDIVVLQTTSTLEPTLTMTPIPTVTKTPIPEIKQPIVMSTTIISTDFGSYYIYGELYNENSLPLKVDFIDIVLYDGDKILDVSVDFMDLKYINPYTSIPFAITSLDNYPEKYTLEFNYKLSRHDDVYLLDITSVNVSDDEYGIKITGVVTNISKEKILFPKIIVFFRDQDKNIVNYDYTFTQDNMLDVNESSVFEINTNYVNYNTLELYAPVD